VNPALAASAATPPTPGGQTATPPAPPGFERGVTVLGRLAAHVEEIPSVGDELVVVGWALAASGGGQAAAARPEDHAAGGGAGGGHDGRRFHAGTAVFRGSKPLAWARAVWFTLASGA
jgi:hypothetical protein